MATPAAICSCYNIAQNSGGTQDVYTGGSGVDTVMIEFTLAQWLDAANQQQITDYLAHLVKVTNPETDQVSNGLASDFTFHFGNSALTLQTMERLRVTVDGVELDPANALAAASADTAGASEDGPSVTIDVLGNDSVPDLVKDLSLVTGPGHDQRGGGERRRQRRRQHARARRGRDHHLRRRGPERSAQSDGRGKEGNALGGTLSAEVTTAATGAAAAP